MSSKGQHICLDYKGFVGTGDWILKLLQDAVAQSGCREVHAHVENFDGSVSPPGFAAVVLIDESHVSAHCYADEGLLALDCFTCGNTEPDIIADYIHMALQRAIPSITLVQRSVTDRFVSGE
jgi:S-adenosylmethionine decarboxylase